MSETANSLEEILANRKMKYNRTHTNTHTQHIVNSYNIQITESFHVSEGHCVSILLARVY